MSGGEAAEATLAIEGGSPVRRRMLPYGRQSVSDADVAAVVRALRSDWLTTGPLVREFEDQFARRLGVGHAVAVSNGTAALHAAMHAIGVGPGDEVIIPAITFVATANAVLYQCGLPVFADVAPDTLLLDPESVAASITPATKVIVVVDYAGQPVDYDRFRALACEHNLLLVSDACHALGARFRGQPVGTLADISTFSFHAVKTITTGEGGMVATNDKMTADRVRAFRNHGISSDHRQRDLQGTFEYDMNALGFNYRLTDLQCALGLSQLQSLDEFLQKRQEIAAFYDHAFTDVLNVQPLCVEPDRVHARHLYVLLFDLEALTADRAALYRALRAEGIGVNVHYRPVYLQPYYRQHVAETTRHCPNADAVYSRMLTVPLFAGMSRADAEDVVAAVRKVVTRYRR